MKPYSLDTSQRELTGAAIACKEAYSRQGFSTVGHGCGKAQEPLPFTLGDGETTVFSCLPTGEPAKI